jgi:hypothetical protein
LLAVMERLGVGEGMLRWVRLLLTDTKSAALVHGRLMGWSGPDSPTSALRNHEWYYCRGR